MKTKYVVAGAAFLLASMAAIAMVINSLSAGPTVPGPETPALSAGLNGIVLTHDGDAIYATSFPSGVSHVAVSNARGKVFAISGPDNNGLIAYLENDSFLTSLHVTSIDGANASIIFTSTATDAQKAPDFGGSLALSPQQRQLALITHLGSVQMPDSLLRTGKLEIWDVARKKKQPLSPPAIDDGLAWLPDGKHLIFVDMAPNPTTRDYQDYGMKYKAWTSLPTAYMLDTVTGKKTKIGAGEFPVVSTNGKFVILCDGDRHLRRINLATLASQPLSPPGGSLILAQDGALVVYGAVRTTGVPAKLAYSHGGIGPLGTIKTAQMNTGKFQTLLPNVDTMSPMSFGNNTPQNQKLLASAPKVDLSH